MHRVFNKLFLDDNFDFRYNGHSFTIVRTIIKKRGAL